MRTDETLFTFTLCGLTVALNRGVPGPVNGDTEYHLAILGMAALGVALTAGDDAVGSGCHRSSAPRKLAVATVTAVLVTGTVVGAPLGVVGVATAAGDQEPNDDFETAQRLVEGETDGEITSGDADLYEIRLNSTDALHVNETRQNDGRGKGLNLKVYGPDRNELASDSNRGGTSPITVEASENGTHYVEVVGESDSVTKNYTLNVNKVTPPENDRFAPNDDFASAATLPEGFSDAKVWGGESDFYAIELNSTDALRVEEAGDNDGRGKGLNLKVYGPDRNELASDRNRGGTSPITVKASENGTHYVEVVGESDSVTKNYTLNVNKVTPPENDQFAPNDDFASAATITSEFSDAKVWGGESDFYRVGLNASESLEIAVTQGELPLTLEIYGPDRERLANDRNFGGVGPQTIRAPETGVYYIEIGGEEKTTTAQYTLRSNQTGVTARQQTHESGVPQPVFTAASGGDGSLNRSDVLSAVRSYVQNEQIGGIEVGRADVLALVTYYVRST